MIQPIHYREMWIYFLSGNPLSERLAVIKFDVLHARYFYFLVYFARLLGHNITKFKRNKETFYIIGDSTMKSDDERKLNLKCLLCSNVVYSSSAGLSQHQKSKHNQGSKKGVNWDWTTDLVTFKNRRAELSQQQKGLVPSRRGPKPTIDRPRPQVERPFVLTPDQKFIEIPAVIRVPISIGQAEILQS